MHYDHLEFYLDGLVHIDDGRLFVFRRRLRIWLYRVCRSDRFELGLIGLLVVVWTVVVIVMIVVEMKKWFLLHWKRWKM